MVEKYKAEGMGLLDEFKKFGEWIETRGTEGESWKVGGVYKWI